MLTLLADTGDLLRFHPTYNAATLVELAQFVAPNAQNLLWATPEDPEHPARFAFESAGYTLTPAYPDWAWAELEQKALWEALGPYKSGRERLNGVRDLERDLYTRLTAPLNAQTIHSSEFLAHIRDHHQKVSTVLEEGPATAHREKRLTALAGLLEARMLEGQAGVALVALDDVWELLERLPNARLPALEGFRPGESSRIRALTDRALRLEEGDDLAGLLEGLMREDGDALTPRAELEYAASGLYFSVGDLESAKILLERAGHAQLEHPRYLFGLVFARLGQVRDALKDREGALRAYKATLALGYAPKAALEVAQKGLNTPLGLEGSTPSGEA
jgi:tetratricopeptide (TPR) repeat protein